MKYGVGLWIFGNLADRFLPTGYKKPVSPTEKLELAAKVKGVKGIEPVYPGDVSEVNIDEFKSISRELGVKVAVLSVDVCCEKKWSRGALSALDEDVRKSAVERVVKACEVAKELGATIVNIWPGQDGYDYYFQVDYRKALAQFVKSVKEIAEKADGVKIALEYKVKEPRMRLFLSTAWRALLLVREVGLENVGVTVDVGHSFYNRENVGEVVALLGDKLFHLHLNDNYGDWDDDLIAGSFRLVEYVEMFYWLRKVGYQNWCILDIFPYREDPVRACEVSIEFLKKVENLVNRIGLEKLNELISEGDPAKVVKEVIIGSLK